jgi:tetratricopeptide (TPR) repeat protein
LDTSVAAGSPSRGPKDILLSPSPKGAGMARPELFTFRWRILRTEEGPVSISPLTISLGGCKTDERLWVEKGVDYEKGFYVSEEVRRLLKGKQRPDSAESVEVVVTSASFDKAQRFCFDLISSAEEQRLASELARWDDYADVLRHAERARVFYRHGLYEEAADEFDAALRLSPETDYLLADAIMARFRLGDEDAVDALLSRLRKLSSGGGLYDRMLTLTRRKKRG